MNHPIRLCAFTACLMILAASLDAQERSLLSGGVITSFITNMDAIGDALDETEDWDDFTGRFYLFGMEFMDYVINGTDIDRVRTFYTELAALNLPETDSVFSGYGMGARGLRAFLAMTVGYLLVQLEAALTESAEDHSLSDEEFNKLNANITALRVLVHPGDLSLVKNNMEALEGFFDLVS
jgi:hypothetical protein